MCPDLMSFWLNFNYKLLLNYCLKIEEKKIQKFPSNPFGNLFFPATLKVFGRLLRSRGVAYGGAVGYVCPVV